MKIVEKPWKEGTRYAYANVPEEYLEFEPGIRVLPAIYWEEPKVTFNLIKRWEPGENRFFPEGGFEVRGPSSEIRNYYLDQIIVHPFVFKLAKSEAKRLAIKEAGGKKAYIKSTGDGKRGRKPLTDEQRAERELAKEARALLSNGKRGRPAKPESERKPIKVATGGQRGRPRKDPNSLVVPKVYVPTGGKRGRPAKVK